MRLSRSRGREGHNSWFLSPSYLSFYYLMNSRHPANELCYCKWYLKIYMVILSNEFAHAPIPPFITRYSLPFSCTLYIGYPSHLLHLCCRCCCFLLLLCPLFPSFFLPSTNTAELNEVISSLDEPARPEYNNTKLECFMDLEGKPISSSIHAWHYP